MSMTMTDEIRRVAYPEQQDAVEVATATLRLWLRRASTRRHLRALESHRLADVDLSEAQRRAEGAKWFWQT